MFHILIKKWPRVIYRQMKCIRTNYTYGKPPWKIVFFGTDDFSLSSLKTLFKECKKGSLIKDLEVVTSFQKKQNPVHKYAVRENIKIHDWPIIIPKNKYDIGIVVSFGHLIPENIINSFHLGMLNVHASLLPRWRGAAPIIYAIMNGDSETGITIMRVKPKKFDIGEIITQESVKINSNITLPELSETLSNLGASLLLKSIENLPNSLINSKPQPNNDITYAPRVTPNIAQVVWNKMTAVQVYNLHRALTGLYHLSTRWHGITVKLIDCNINDKSATVPKSAVSVAGNFVYNKQLKQLQILCADNSWVQVSQIGVSGKKVMSATDFYNGFISKCSYKECVFS